jgi:hypothetical protein
MTFHVPAPAAIVIAACATPCEAQAMMRWLQPMLKAWPSQSWTAWISEKPEGASMRAALVSEGDRDPAWRDIDLNGGQLCPMLEQSGLIILTHATIAKDCMRHLEGLAARLAMLETSHPEAVHFKRPFAAFGVSAGI